MTRQGGVALSDAAARTVVRAVGQDLVDRGQIAGVPDPARILVTLTAHHVLEELTMIEP